MAEEPRKQDLDRLVRDVAGDADEGKKKFIPILSNLENPRLFSGKQESLKPQVASFIAHALVWVFVIQAITLTAAFIWFTWKTFPVEDDLTRTSEAVIRGIQVILPVTTTLLGVAMGYYFRDETERAKEEREGLVEE